MFIFQVKPEFHSLIIYNFCIICIIIILIDNGKSLWAYHIQIIWEHETFKGSFCLVSSEDFFGQLDSGIHFYPGVHKTTHYYDLKTIASSFMEIGNNQENTLCG